MGLKTDILEAKKKALEAQNIEVRDKDFEEGSPNEIEARYMTEAFVNFLTHDDLHFTISKLKASVELEEFKLSGDIDANVKSEKVVKDKISEISAVKTGVDFLVGYVERITTKEVPVVKMTIGEILPPLGELINEYKSFWKTVEKAVTKSIPKSEGEDDINIPAFDFRKDGGKHGDEMDGRGHAYIGVEDPVKNSDTMDPESDDNQVDLYRDKIPDEILD